MAGRWSGSPTRCGRWAPAFGRRTGTRRSRSAAGGARRSAARAAAPGGRRLGGPAGPPPTAIRGGRLQAIEHRTEVPSAQVKSAVLLAGLAAEGSTTVREPAPTRDHTERALAAPGAPGP